MGNIHYNITANVQHAYPTHASTKQCTIVTDFSFAWPQSCCLNLQRVLHDSRQTRPLITNRSSGDTRLNAILVGLGTCLRDSTFEYFTVLL